MFYVNQFSLKYPSQYLRQPAFCCFSCAFFKYIRLAKLLRHNFLHDFMCSPLFVVKTLRKYGLHNVGSIKFTHFTPAELNLPSLQPQAITIILQSIYSTACHRHHSPIHLFNRISSPSSNPSIHPHLTIIIIQPIYPTAHHHRHHCSHLYIV